MFVLVQKALASDNYSKTRKWCYCWVFAWGSWAVYGDTTVPTLTSTHQAWTPDVRRWISACYRGSRGGATIRIFLETRKTGWKHLVLDELTRQDRNFSLPWSDRLILRDINTYILSTTCLRSCKTSGPVQRHRSMNNHRPAGVAGASRYPPLNSKQRLSFADLLPSLWSAHLKARPQTPFIGWNHPTRHNLLSMYTEETKRIPIPVQVSPIWESWKSLVGPGSC